MAFALGCLRDGGSAARQGITDVRVDWRSALPELRPDIVVVATPAEVHCEIAQVAAGNGCHDGLRANELIDQIR